MSENIKIYKKTEEGYPKTLLQLPDAPARIYVLGELPDPTRPAIAIVGARNCSSYGKNMAYEYARVLTKAGVQVISGLARGVDAAAHAGALAAGGKTYGVMGCGVDFCYPTSSRNLYHTMQQQGGILSEFSPGTPPLAYHFPLRNRIISGLSQAVLVVEAKEKSGSLITVEWALEQGKDIYALPGRVGDALSGGCNRLLKVGAGVLTSAKDILEELHIEEKNRASKITSQENLLEKDFSLVYIELGLQPINISELIEKTGIEYERLSEILLQLQLDGMVEQPMENYYARVVV